MHIPPLLRSQVCAITGGLTGIGRAIAISFLSHGARVAINYFPGHNSRDEELLASLKTDAEAATRARSGIAVTTNEVAFLAVPGDISLPMTGTNFVDQVVARFGHLDTFVSNAGVCAFSDFLSVTPNLLSSHVNTNLTGAFYAVQAAARQMSSQSPAGGSIIGIASISALVGGALQTHYTPTKAGVNSLMQSCACALGKYHIRCNALLPGTVLTQLNEEQLRGGTAERTYMEGRVPLGRLGKPEDLAGPAVWLACGELSGYVTGASVLVDGGLYVNLQ